MPGVVDYAKKHLRLPVVIGRPQGVETVIDRVQDSAFATAAGLVLWNGKFGRGAAVNFGGAFKNLFKGPGMDKIRKWVKSLLP